MSPSRKIPAPPVFTIRAGGVHERWTCSFFTHSSLRKSKVLDFSVGNWEKVLLLFTRLPGVLYFTLDWDSGFFMAGELEEELNSLLKLQVVKSQRATGGGRGVGRKKKKECGDRARHGGHQRTTQSRRPEIRRVRVREKHAGRTVNHRL